MATGLQVPMPESPLEDSAPLRGIAVRSWQRTQQLISRSVMCELTPSCAMGSRRMKNQVYEDISVNTNLNELPHNMFSLKKAGSI